MRFTQAHGTANDFVVLEDLDDRLDLSDVLVRALCDRRRGLGADGVLRIGRARGAAAVFMDYRNADGSIVEMCGNGIRVVAKHVADHALVPDLGDTLTIGTRAGDKAVRLHRGGDGRVAEVSVDMGPPVWAPSQVPFRWDDPEAIDVPVDLGEAGKVRLTAVSMGNPHAVLRVEDVSEAPVRTLGPRLEGDDRFPQRVNVSFAQALGRDRVRLRVWERGVGETAACGTGACATVVALQRLGELDEQVAVELPGGTLTVAYDGDGGVRMTGPAVEVATGELDAAWLAAARAGAWDTEGFS